MVSPNLVQLDHPAIDDREDVLQGLGLFPRCPGTLRQLVSILPQLLRKKRPPLLNLAHDEGVNAAGVREKAAASGAFAERIHRFAATSLGIAAMI
jgi:hypothetical protein